MGGKRKGEEEKPSEVSLPVNSKALPFKVALPPHERAKRRSAKRGPQSVAAMARLRAGGAARDAQSDSAARYEQLASLTVLPPRHYCDVTGVEAKYRDPVTGLRFASAAVFRLVRAGGDEWVDKLLALRNARRAL